MTFNINSVTVFIFNWTEVDYAVATYYVTRFNKIDCNRASMFCL